MVSVKQFGSLVRAYRDDTGLRAAAKEIGISPTTLSRVERGEIPDFPTIERIAAWMGKEVQLSLVRAPK